MGDELEVNRDPERRLVLSIEESLRATEPWVAIEPNGESLWSRVRQELSEYLTASWQRGDLVGTKPEQAFFVRCDRSTMTQADLDAGRLVCLVGVAAVKPAEFVLIRIGQWTPDAKDRPV